MNFGTLLLCALIGLIFGIIGGALWLVIKVILSQKKAIKDYKEKKIMEIKNNPNQIINEKKEVKKEEIKVPVPEVPNNSPQEKLGDTPTHQRSSENNPEEGKVSKEKNETAILEDSYNKENKSYSEKKEERRKKKKDRNKNALNQLFGKKEKAVKDEKKEQKVKKLKEEMERNKKELEKLSNEEKEKLL